MTNFLVADIGGTNMRLGHSTPDGVMKIKTYKCADYPGGPEEIITAYCKEMGIQRPKQAVFAVAGPVNNPASFRFTNGKWNTFDIDFTSMGMDMVLINDFAAQAYALEILQPEDYKTIITPQNGPGLFYASNIKKDGIKSRKINPFRSIVILGAGTGLGEAIAHEYQGELLVVSAEGGHVPAAIKPEEMEFIEKIKIAEGITDNISYETLLCGKGLARLYEAISGKKAPPLDRIDAMAKRKGPAQMAHELYATIFARCIATHVYSSNARNVIIPGGVITKMGEAFNIAALQKELRAPSHSLGSNNFLPDVPVAVVTNTNSGVYGSHAYAQYHLN